MTLFTEWDTDDLVAMHDVSLKMFPGDFWDELATFMCKYPCWAKVDPLIGDHGESCVMRICHDYVPYFVYVYTKDVLIPGMTTPTMSQLRHSLIKDLGYYAAPDGITDFEYFEYNTCRPLASFIFDHVDKYYEDDEDEQ